MRILIGLCAILSTIANVLGYEDQAPTIYVYAYSWTPGFCENNAYPGCINSLPYWRNNFTIHGLWPQYLETGYPASCSTEPFDQNIPQQIGEYSMIQHWPDVQYEINSSSYDSFWSHEWSKHGTCSGLTQYQYFNEAIELTYRIPTPDVLSDAIGQNISANVLRDSMGGAVLQCKNQVLNGLYTCWNHTDHIPSNQIQCPQSVLNEDTCVKSDEVIILSL